MPNKLDQLVTDLQIHNFSQPCSELSSLHPGCSEVAVGFLWPRMSLPCWEVHCHYDWVPHPSNYHGTYGPSTEYLNLLSPCYEVACQKLTLQYEKAISPQLLIF